jgi:hypothetical protein
MSSTANDLAAIVEKAAALDLLEQWLDVHPERQLERAFKSRDKFHIGISPRRHETYSSETQETLASAIRTVIQIAISNGDSLK